MSESIYRVMRQDDNGNKFVVTTCCSREEAEELVRKYTAKGHKQTYWCEPETAPTTNKQ